MSFTGLQQGAAGRGREAWGLGWGHGCDERPTFPTIAPKLNECVYNFSPDRTVYVPFLLNFRSRLVLTFLVELTVEVEVHILVGVVIFLEAEGVIEMVVAEDRGAKLALVAGVVVHWGLYPALMSASL